MTKKLIALLILCLLPFTQIQTTQAAEKSGSISLSYKVPGAEFDIYRVGSLDSSGNITLLDSFSGYSVDLTEKTAAATLSSYVIRDNIAPTKSGVTDSGGDLTFSGLEEGAYLVLGVNCTVDDVDYTASPVILSLKGDTASSNPKYTTTITTTPTPTTTTTLKTTNTKVSVKKVWKNDDSSSRPKSVTVQLLCAGEVYDTQTLSSSNNWSYTWSRLDSSKTWSVVEKSVPSGYRVSISQNSNTFTITNKGTTTTTTTTKLKSPKPRTRLPQTGQLWWPVSVLAFLGTALLIIGMFIRKRS